MKLTDKRFWKFEAMMLLCGVMLLCQMLVVLLCYGAEFESCNCHILWLLSIMAKRKMLWQLSKKPSRIYIDVFFDAEYDLGHSLKFPVFDDGELACGGVHDVAGYADVRGHQGMIAYQVDGLANGGLGFLETVKPAIEVDTAVTHQ